jgi:hypothetical protein
MEVIDESEQAANVLDLPGLLRFGLGFAIKQDVSIC